MEMDDVVWIDAQEVVGTPSMVLLPARNYKFKVLKDQYKISIPKRGDYNNIDPEFFDKKSGIFDLLNNDILYLPSISKVLFATKKYPDLKTNQLFAPISIKFNDNSVDIFGQLLEMI